MILSRRELDAHLKKALEQLFENWTDPKVSIVAAALVDGDKAVYATNTQVSEGKRRHAERCALERFKEQYGNPSKDAVMIVTLSPCFIDTPVREGDSCSEMLKKEGIQYLYIGAMDKLQGHKISAYKKLGIEAEVCKDRNIAQCCYMLEDMFERHKKERENGGNWLAIKQSLQDSLLCPKNFFQTKIKDQDLLR